LLFRQDFDFILERRGPISIASLPDSTVVRTGFEESGSEIWSGLSYAHRVGETLSVGVSAYLSYRTHRSRRETFVAAETPEEFAFLALRNDYDYTHIGLLAKVGVGGRTGGLHYGMTLTTPRLRLSSSGSRAFDRALTVGAVDGSDLLVITDTDIQGNLQSTYRSPLSLGAGLAYEFARTGIHLAAEWFDDVSPYRLLDADRVLDADTGRPIDLDLITSSVSVVNVGVGLEHRFGDRVHGYLGFHTDRSAAGTGNLQQQLAVWDIYHASIGTSVRLGATRVALGAVYAFGDEPLTGEIRLDADESDELPQDIEASYRSFLLLLGFDVDY
jgi:hypothetical protein